MFSEKIRILLIKRNIGVTELAKMLDCTASNITNKLKRDNFSEKELMSIAEALGCKFEGHFRIPETGEEV
jgi:transcriptional regulator with XRE-family HTH domain